jgi:hypothetical protein
MSCYIVEELTINEIVTGAWLNPNTKAFMKDKGYDLDKLNQRQSLCYDLLEMNKEAYRIRYHGETIELAEHYKHKTEMTNKYQILKDAKCLLYQCTEGNITTDDYHYKILENLIWIWTNEILDELPAYQKAIWR